MSVTHTEVMLWLKSCAKVISENRAYLIELDSAIGDADHGANMDRGFQAIMAKLDEMENQDIGSALKTAGMTLVSTVGGAGGPLYGTFFLQIGMQLVGKTEITLDDWCAALEAGVNGVMQRGKAQPGDKTMLDALVPALQALKDARSFAQSFSQAIQASAAAALMGMQATIPLVARKGRASYLGERSAGHQDPGATSSYLILQAAADAWSDPA